MSKTIEKTEVEIPIRVTAYTGDRQPMFMRSVRAEGTTPTGEECEVAVNELGAGIIIRIGDRTFSISELALVEAIDQWMQGSGE